MSNLTRKQREIMRKMQLNNSYNIFFDSYGSCWFVPTSWSQSVFYCKNSDVKTLVNKELVVVKMDSKDSLSGIATLTEKGKEWKCDSWWECAKKWFA